MKNDNLTKEQVNEILQALDEVIEQGPWDDSNFLKVMGQNLRNMRDEFIQKSESSRQQLSDNDKHIAHQLALRHGRRKIYIGLYSSEGRNMLSWERIVANLPRQMISRPIYADEQDIQEMIKTKENKFNEAYVSVYISEQDILPLSADKLPVDKLGKSMLMLKDNTVNLDNVESFVHQSGSYHLSHGRLIKD